MRNRLQKAIDDALTVPEFVPGGVILCPSAGHTIGSFRGTEVDDEVLDRLCRQPTPCACNELPFKEDLRVLYHQPRKAPTHMSIAIADLQALLSQTPSPIAQGAVNTWRDVLESEKESLTRELSTATMREILNTTGRVTFVPYSETRPGDLIEEASVYGSPPLLYVWHVFPRSRPDISDWRAVRADFTKVHPISFDSRKDAERAALQLLDK